MIAYRAAQAQRVPLWLCQERRDNIDERELADLKKLARHYLSYSDVQIATALAHRELVEVVCDEQEEG